jgi:hypothetical protein
VSADPLEVHAPGQADANLYAYVSGAALRNVDPLGLDGEDAQGGNSSASSQPTPVPFGPEGAAPGTRFVFGGGPDRLVPQTDYELVTSGKQEFVYDPKADLGTIDPNKLSSEAFIQVVKNAINKALSGGGNCSGPACGTARRGEEGAGGPTNGSDAVAMGAGLLYGAGPEAGGKPNGSPGGRCASCEGSDAQQLVVGGVQVVSTLGVGGAVKGAATQAARGASGASSALKGAQLNRHLSQLEKYGQAGFKELQNGRIRYFGDVSKATKPGEMMGRRVVREWNPATNSTRTWMETLDHAGRVRIVRPETGGPKIHYMFDAAGTFTGTF